MCHGCHLIKKKRAIFAYTFSFGFFCFSFFNHVLLSVWIFWALATTEIKWTPRSCCGWHFLYLTFPENRSYRIQFIGLQFVFFFRLWAATFMLNESVFTHFWIYHTFFLKHSLRASSKYANAGMSCTHFSFLVQWWHPQHLLNTFKPKVVFFLC